MTLEQQLVKLAELGLRLDNGVTIDDLLKSFGREEYEQEPFDLLLFVLGIEVEGEPWRRNVCARVWNFDTECIVETGNYTKIVKRLCEVAGQPDYLKNVSDLMDPETDTAWIKYTVNGHERHWPVEIDSDWADMRALSKVMADIEHDGCRFFFKDNGQAAVLFYLDASTAAALNKLSNNALAPVLG